MGARERGSSRPRYHRRVVSFESSEFGVEEIERDGGVMLRVRGDVDVTTVRGLEQALNGRLDGLGPPLALDLAAVTYLGSDGIRALIAARDRALAAGRRLEIVAASAIVQRVLDVVGLDASLSPQAPGA
jgi:anti-anti-sigma factor